MAPDETAWDIPWEAEDSPPLNKKKKKGFTSPPGPWGQFPTAFYSLNFHSELLPFAFRSNLTKAIEQKSQPRKNTVSIPAASAEPFV